MTQDQVVEQLRQRMKAYPGFKPQVLIRGALGGGEQASFPIQVNMLGPDMGKLADYSMKVLAQVQQTPSLADAKVTVNISTSSSTPWSAPAPGSGSRASRTRPSAACVPRRSSDRPARHLRCVGHLADCDEVFRTRGNGRAMAL